jgi:hypothetical protein
MRFLIVSIVTLFLSCMLFAQVSVNLNFNIDRQPVWGPTGYDYVQYYYLPDIEVYYSISQHMFFYYDGGRWIGRSRLPSRYRNYDLYNSYKVVVNEPRPYRNHQTFRDQYSSYKGRHDQQVIRDSRDTKYFVNKNHPEHNNWKKQQKHDNGNGKGKSQGKKGGNKNNR